MGLSAELAKFSTARGAPNDEIIPLRDLDKYTVEARSGFLSIIFEVGTPSQESELKAF